MQKTVRFSLSLIAIGIAAGLVGVGLTFLLHSIQHFFFSYGNTGVEMSFREGVGLTSAVQRWFVLTLCGVVVGFGWWAIHRFGAPLVSVRKSLDEPQKGVPFFTTVAHGLLQIITVGMGSPLGREVAPREISVAVASVWLKKCELTNEDAKLLLACASGAGLTAVYNVPFAATLFIFETLLIAFNPRAMLGAMVTILIATAVSRACLGDLVQYADLPNVGIPDSAMAVAVLIGVLIGIAVNFFRCALLRGPFIPRDSKWIIVFAIWAFCLIGLLSLYQPEILGNGKAGNQLTFWGMIGWQESLFLTALKWLAIWLALAAGAYGGLITPSMMLGSTLAYALAIGWNVVFPQCALPVEVAAIVGASTFLGIKQKMPLTAIVFVLELTRSSPSMLMPLGIAMAVAMVTDRICHRLEPFKPL